MQSGGTEEIAKSGECFMVFDEGDLTNGRELLGTAELVDGQWECKYKTVSFRMTFRCPSFPRLLLAIEHVRQADRAIRCCDWNQSQ